MALEKLNGTIKNYNRSRKYADFVFNDASWMDGEVKRWARANPRNLERGESNTEWQALRAEHEQEVREKIQQVQARSQQFWEYNNKHFQTLFGEKNQVKK